MVKKEKNGRIPHKLSKNTKNSKLRYLIFFDSESRLDAEKEQKVRHKPYLICAEFWDLLTMTENKRIYINNDLYQFWEDVVRLSDHPLLVMAHNACYDMLVTETITTLCKHEFKAESFFEKGMSFAITFTRKMGGKKSKTVKIISSSNFYPFSLETIGKVFNLEKKSFDFELGTLEEAIPYCERDVAILRTAIFHFMAFIEEEDLGSFASTTPAQAFRAFKKRFMKHDIYIHNTKRFIEMEREAYFGGRTECFQIGNFTGDFHYYDINSMYSSVMVKDRFPTRQVKFRKHLTINQLKDFIDNDYLVCSKVLIQTSIPLYPVRDKNKLLFPIGNFWTTLTTPEISLALGYGHIQEIGETVIYLADCIFKEYVEYFHAKKQQAKTENNKIMETLYKLFLNSLYGKFGQLQDNWEIVGETDNKVTKSEIVKDYQTGETHFYKIFGGRIFKKFPPSEGFDAFCAIAAHVTGYARVLLTKLIMMAGWENVFYVDTDSLFVNNQGKKNLEQSGIIGNNIGQLQFVKSCQELTINAPKDYVFGEDIRIKGIKKSSVLLDTEAREYMTTVFPRLSGWLKSKTDEGGEDKEQGYYHIMRKKVISGKYTKGVVLPNGHISPFNTTVSHGKNCILDLQEDGKEQQEMEKYYTRHWKKEREEVIKNIRRTIMELGGVNDPDYQDLPRWSKRKNGRRLDVIVDELKHYGIHCQDANELSSLLSSS